MKVKSESEVIQSCPSLNDPTDCSLPDSSVHGIFQARVPEWGAAAFSTNVIREMQIETIIHYYTLMKLQYFGHLMRRLDSLENTLMLGRIGSRRERG